ncbi:NHL repeat-containing protein [Balneolales bacterium ANBcel1]|nr:NHL repeat-containing protein [Balneolales bacterium ANBcel1]
MTHIAVLCLILPFWMAPGPMPMPDAPGVTGSPQAEPRSPVLTGLSDAVAVRASSAGHLFIVERGRNRILKIDTEGVRIDSAGRLGSGDYQFDNPVAIDPTNELKIYVADRNNRRIQVFDRRFQYIGTVSLPQRAGYGQAYRPALITTDYAGRLFFYDEERHRVFRIDSNGQYDLSFELFGPDDRVLPLSMTILDEVIWVADSREQVLHRFSLSGSYLGFLHLPEPVRALARAHRELWVMGSAHIMQIDGTGEILRRVSLPEMAVGQASPLTWRSFTILGRQAWLLHGSGLVRMDLGPMAD